MKKFKCDVCSTIHGGFHLCIKPETAHLIIKPSSEMKEPKVRVRVKDRRYEGTQEERWERYRKDTAERDARIVGLYSPSCGASQISKLLGVSQSTVLKVLRENNVKMNPRGYNFRFKEQA